MIICLINNLYHLMMIVISESLDFFLQQLLSFLQNNHQSISHMPARVRAQVKRLFPTTESLIKRLHRHLNIIAFVERK